MSSKISSEKTVRDIPRATRKRYSAEEKIRIVLDGLGGEFVNVSFESPTTRWDWLPTLRLDYTTTWYWHWSLLSPGCSMAYQKVDVGLKREDTHALRSHNYRR